MLPDCFAVPARPESQMSFRLLASFTNIAFTTFPVDAALHRSIHRPTTEAQNRHSTLENKLFLANCQIGVVERN